MYVCIPDFIDMTLWYCSLNLSRIITSRANKIMKVSTTIGTLNIAGSVELTSHRLSFHLGTIVAAVDPTFSTVLPIKLLPLLSLATNKF